MSEIDIDTLYKNMLAKCAGCKKISQCKFDEAANKLGEIIEIAEVPIDNKAADAVIDKMFKTLSELRQVIDKIECEVQDLEGIKGMLNMSESMFSLLKGLRKTQQGPEQ